MKIYFDTSVVASLYIRDCHSSMAAKLVREAGTAIAFPPLVEIEIRNSISLGVFQDRLSMEAQGEALALLDEDIKAGVLAPLSVQWSEVIAQAAILSRRYTHTIGCRTLDILHVATALLCDFGNFATFDSRQRELALALGLTLM